MPEIDETFGLALFVFLAILIVFGIIGNILSFITWSRGQRCRLLPISAYFKPLAVVDTCILLFPAMELLMFLPPIKVLLRDVNNVFCKILPFTISSSLRLSTWVTVSFSIEKVLHVYLPFKFPFKQNNRRVYLTLGVMCLVSYGINVPFLIDQHISRPVGEMVSNYTDGDNGTLGRAQDSDITHVDNTTIPGFNAYQCRSKPNSITKKYIVDWEILFNLFAFFGIPFIILLTCNVLILFKMSKRVSIMGGNLSEQQQIKRNNQFKLATYQVIALSIVQCVSSSPMCILEVHIVLMSESNKQDPLLFSNFFEIYYMFNCIYYLNSAVNFILYCSVGRDFRQDFVELFRACRT